MFEFPNILWICTPSRASFLTGLYPSANHVNQNGNAEFPARMSEHRVTRRLADEAGYRCGLIGKLHLASAFAGQENAARNQYQQWLGDQGVDLDDIFVRNDRGVHASYRADADPDLHQTTWCAEQAIQLIRQYGEGDGRGSTARPSPTLRRPHDDDFAAAR